MRYRLFIVILLGCTACLAFAGDKSHRGPSKRDLKLAEQSFQHGVELQHEGQLDEAFKEFTLASSLAPTKLEYVSAREVVRSRIAASYIQHGNLLAEIGDAKGAQIQFKNALAIEPENGFAQQRLHDVSPDDSEHQHVLQLLASVEDVHVNPKPGKSNFHIHGDSRQLYDAIGKAFGVLIAYDPALTTHRVRFDIDDLNFFTAMGLAGKATKTFWAPVDKNQVIVANDTQELRKQYQRMALQTFYVNEAATTADLNDIANVLRNVFEVRMVSVIPDKDIITVRAPKEQMEIIAEMLDEAIRGRPEVLLEIRAYEVDYDKLSQYGLNLPYNFSVFNVYAALYSALGPAAQALITEFQQTGVINPALVPATSLAGLQGSPLLQSFLFFGNGYGLTGVTVSPISGQLSENKSYATDLEHVTLRASSGTPATMMIGTRFPISLGSFTNVSISTSGQAQVGSAIPQVQYEDLGLIFKVTPHLQTGENVNLDLELQIKGLGAQQLNGIPVLTNRDYKGSITVRDGEPSLLAGDLEDSDTRSGSGFPGVGQLPALNSVLNTNSKDHSRTEIVITVTPHIIRKSFRNLENFVWNASEN